MQRVGSTCWGLEVSLTFDCTVKPHRRCVISGVKWILDLLGARVGPYVGIVSHPCRSCAQEIQNRPPDSQPMKPGHMIANSFLVVRVLIWRCLVKLSMNEDVENMTLQEEALNFDFSEPFPQASLH